MLVINEISYDDKYKLFNIDIEGETIFLSYEELEEFKLSVGDKIDFSSFEKLSILSSKNEALSCAVKYISNRLVSSEKVRTHLIKKGFENEIIDLVIKVLKDNQIIDDKLYLEYYIKDKIDINLRSKKHIFYDLISQNFDEDQINIYLESYTIKHEIKTAIKLLERKNYVNRKSNQQIYSYLARRGFNPEVISSVLEKLKNDGDEI